MKRWHILLFLFIILSLVIATAVFGQAPEQPETFRVSQLIGWIRPLGVKYNPVLNQVIMSDALSQLVLADATNFETQHILIEQGLVNAYEYSHDGKWIALAIDRRIELWNAETGLLEESFEPEGVLSITGELIFSPNDELLMFNSIVPAPAATRRSENDTSNVPWIWDLPSIRGERSSILFGGTRARPFFGFRNGFIMTPNNRAIVGLAGRLQLIDVLASGETPPITEIESSRFEPDPIHIWFSPDADHIYISPIGRNSLVQVDTLTGAQAEIFAGRELNYYDNDILEQIRLSDATQIIGQPYDEGSNDLLNLLLGDNYRRQYAYHPLTVTFIDVLEPVFENQNEKALLLYVFDENAGRGTIEFLRPQGAIDFQLNPSKTHLLVQRDSQNRQLEYYNLSTGILEKTFYPDLPDTIGDHLLTFNWYGDELLVDFQRFSVVSGERIFDIPDYRFQYQEFYFTDDSESLVTINGLEWQLWDVATGQLKVTQDFALRGSIIDRSRDGSRLLMDLSEGESTQRYEVLDIATQDRHTLTFENVPNQSIWQIIPSPDWQNYLVVYNPNPFDSLAVGDAIALYNLHEGKQWFISSSDLPGSESRFYGWVDNQTIYAGINDFQSLNETQRTYGLDHHVTGIPNCLVETFPDDWGQWVDIWEQYNSRFGAERLNQLSQNVCFLLEDDVTATVVNNFLFPSPTPTLPPVTATPSLIVGVPTCITNFYQNASQYATVWREITVGLSDAEKEDMEDLLCAGLQAPLNSSRTTGESITNPEVMTINIETQIRAKGGFIPEIEREEFPSLELVLDVYEEENNIRPGTSILSPDARYLAARTRSGNILIFTLDRPYAELEATAFAEFAEQQDDPPKLLAVLPTATPGFQQIGQPRPTFTPTVTPTSPPIPTQIVEQVNYDVVQDMCMMDTLYTPDNPPPNFDPPGSLFLRMPISEVTWVLDPLVGHYYPDETLPNCDIEITCQFSFNLEWVYTTSNGLSVFRPDGSDETVIFDTNYGLLGQFWRGLETLEIGTTGYILEESRNELQLSQEFHPSTGELTEPILVEEFVNVTVNELSTQMVRTQPNDGKLAIVATQFNTGTGFGKKYYLYDDATGEFTYFARLNNEGEMTFIWHPLGHYLYYTYPGDPTAWHLYDPQTNQHRYLGEFYGGMWSRDGRHRADWFTLLREERDERIEQELPLPKVQIWDTDTGLLRQYCIPTSEERSFNSSIHWSPDNRYLAFTGTLPQEDAQLENRDFFILDTQTGAVMQLALDDGDIIVWANMTPERIGEAD